MMKFRTRYDRIEKISHSGSPIAPVRAGEIKNNQLVVVDKAEKDLYSFINSYADSVNIHVLLNRFKNGDTEALMQRAGAYIDISAMPANINEFMDLARNAENVFNQLPIEVKESFNNNVLEFISTVGDDDWREKMSKSPAQIYADKNEDFKEAQKAHKKSIKGFDNSVYGDDYKLDPVVESPTPSVNPITGNEVKG